MQRTFQRTMLSIVAALWIAGSSHASEPTPSSLIDAMLGVWHGSAIETPHGPLPYDLTFAMADDGSIHAVAKLRLAEHRWRFVLSDKGLRLRFLTTFRGNRRPLWLNAERVTRTQAIFRADRNPDVRVTVRCANATLELEVTLRDQPHVLIRLRR